MLHNGIEWKVIFEMKSLQKIKLLAAVRGRPCAGWEPEETGKEATRRRSGTQTEERMSGAQETGDLGRPGDKH